MRVLVLSSPIYAHTVNAASFVDGLAARGAEVHWGLADDLLGAVSHGPAELRGTGTAPPFPATSGRLREVSRRYTWLLQDARVRVAKGLALADEVRPDVVLTDSLGHVGAVVAERLELPWVSFGDGPLHFPDENTPPFGAGLPYRTEPAWQRRNRVVRAATRHLVLARAQQVYAVLRQEAGLPPSDVPVLEAALSPLLHLHCGVPELEYPRRALPAHVHFVGALRPQAPKGWDQPAWWDDIIASGPVLATQGTLRADPAELLGPVLTVLRRRKLAGILTTGPGDPGVLGGPGLVADGVAVERFVPYEPVLRHARVMVTNGGWTGVLLALAHGVPVIQVGRTEEKADIGRRVEWAGAGAHLPTADLRELDATVERAVTDPAVRASAAGLAASLARRDPGRDGAALVEQLVRG